MVDWAQFVISLGKTEASQEFNELRIAIGEEADISSDPIEYNDPLGQTKYYSFTHSGIEIGFRKNVLNHIHFYFTKNEGYDDYKGKLISNICKGWNEEKIRNVLGTPSLTGGGKEDVLLGYINRWIKYEKDNYALHFQFNQNDKLSRVTLMKSNSSNA